MAQSQPSSARDQVRDVVPSLIDLSEKVSVRRCLGAPELSKRDRSLIVCATLIALGREKQLVGHLERALDNGVTKRRDRRNHHPPGLLCRLAGGDDCGAGRQGRVRKVAADSVGKYAREGEMKIGFIGLGMMGSGMAANLQKAGHELVVHDLRRAAAEPYLAAGAIWADTPRAVAEASEVVFTSLPGPPEVEAVALGENGLL